MAKAMTVSGKTTVLGGVAVGAQIIGVGDEDLIHNVIEGGDKQRYDAGNRVFPHEPAQLFLGQIGLTGRLIHFSSS